ncbi:GGDEF domain-containing protein [soil metagenome]
MIDATPEGHRASIRRWHQWGFLGVLGTVAFMMLAPRVLDVFTPGIAILGLSVFVIALVLWAESRRLPFFDKQSTLLIWPIVGCSSVTLLGVLAPEAAQLLLAVYVLSSLYVGLCQPVGRSFWLLPPALLGYWFVLDLPPDVAILRLPVVALTWSLVSECPARLLARLDAQQKVLTRLAATDPLTGLLNRASLDAHLADCEPDDVIVLIDLDNFKNVNDRQGHVAGDALLVDFATTLSRTSRTTDSVYRYGGEEFLIVLNGSSMDNARMVVKRLGVEWGRHSSALTFSAGVVRGGGDALGRVDKVLYQAKQQGRGLVLSDP